MGIFRLVALMFVGWLLYRFWKNHIEPRLSAPEAQVPENAQLSDPYQILGVTPADSAETIRRAYESKLSEYHPDKVATMAPEFQEVAEQKTKAINWAYRELSKR